MATKKTLSRDEVLQRAANIRAAIMAFVKKNPGATTVAINQALQEKVAELKASSNIVPGQLSVLRESDQLAAVRDGHALTWYLSEDKPRKARATKAEKAPASAPFQVDIIRGTGRVRIQLAEFVIEIGVVDK